MSVEVEMSWKRPLDREWDSAVHHHQPMGNVGTSGIRGTDVGAKHVFFYHLDARV